MYGYADAASHNRLLIICFCQTCNLLNKSCDKCNGLCKLIYFNENEHSPLMAASAVEDHECASDLDLSVEEGLRMNNNGASNFTIVQLPNIEITFLISFMCSMAFDWNYDVPF